MHRHTNSICRVAFFYEGTDCFNSTTQRSMTGLIVTHSEFMKLKYCSIEGDRVAWARYVRRGKNAWSENRGCHQFLQRHVRYA
jgi:hypothetical protein